jgi:hypothetical protein
MGSTVRGDLPQLIPDIQNWEKYLKFPDLDMFDWDGCFKRNKEYFNPDFPVLIFHMTGLFERLISFMNFENAAIALFDEDQKAATHRLFEKLCEFYDDYFGRFMKYYKFDILHFHDDWGSSRSLFFSPELVREMIVPYLKHVSDWAHERGMIFNLHSCGKIERLVPLMIEAGVDIWSGQEINDQVGILKEYGDDIMLDCSPLIPATPYTDEEVVQLTEKFLEDFGPYMKSILVSNHVGSKIIYDRVYEYSRKAFAK